MVENLDESSIENPYQNVDGDNVDCAHQKPSFASETQSDLARRLMNTQFVYSSVQSDTQKSQEKKSSEQKSLRSSSSFEQLQPIKEKSIIDKSRQVGRTRFSLLGVPAALTMRELSVKSD